MPYYRVILHGTGVKFSIEGSAKPVIGFYTTRAIRAASREEAIEKAKQSVLAVWATDEYDRANAGKAPELKVDKIEEIGFWRALNVPNGGHTFYADE